MDLVADVGNTRVHLALFEGATLRAQVAIPHDDLESARRDWDAALAQLPRPERVALVHVAPRAAEAFAEWTRRTLGRPPRVFGEDLPCPIPVEVEAPEEVGPDRLANAVWAARTHPGRPAVVVDLGTAITFDVVSAAGAFVGGLIAPGVRLGARALAQGTARLPLVAPGDGPPPVLGKRTRAAIEGGLVWGAVGLVETACARIAAALGAEPAALQVTATGGDADLIAPHCRAVDAVVPAVTLEGVRLALVEGA